MYEKLQKYKCGSCGNENYHIYQEEGNKQRIITECTKCKSQTEITIRPAEIDLKWGKSGDGIMAIY
tara:strand:+ start:1443 stop:1640 length:198 start_codon:yes stop_codon:yes gene_type:complete